MKTGILQAALAFAVLCCFACTSRQTEDYRILSAGIAHESNSFIPYLTTEDDFVQRRGREATEGRAWARLLEDAGMELIPTLHASAGPSGLVASETYEAFRDEILDGLREAMPVDGIFLEMHGAMHVDGYPDAQADFIKQIREIAGEQVIIAASFDLHGNMSQEFIQGLNILSAYRTAPHVDGDETRTRTAALLLEALRRDLSPRTAHIKLPILIPGEKGITSVEPLKTCYESLPEIANKQGLLDASIFVGMPWTDVYRAGMSVQVVAEDEEHYTEAKQEAQKLASAIWEARFQLDFDVPTASLDEAISMSQESDSTVFITDSGDNVTAGAAGDGTLVLERLLAQQVQDAVLAGIVDPEAVDKCVEAGPGAELSLSVGGKIDHVYSQPLPIRGQVLRIHTLSDDPSQVAAVLQVEGIKLVLLNWTMAFTHPDQFQRVEIDPLAHKFVVVKEGYLFPGLRAIAPHTIMALTPGFANQILEELDYTRVRRPIYPLDPDMGWSADQVLPAEN